MVIKDLLTNGLTFIRPSGGIFQIGEKALETILTFIQDEPHKLESGGVLLGRHIIDTNDIVVDQVTIPMTGDRQRYSSFFRSHFLHQVQINQAWNENKGTCTYLGEWHTHSEPVPSPSIVDRVDWQRKLVVDKFSECLFFIILGTETACVWEGEYRSIFLRQLLRVD